MRTRAPDVAPFTDGRRVVVAGALPELRLGAVLGAGAGGWVVAADEASTGRRLAVKVLLGDRLPASATGRPPAEVEILIGCRHRHLIRAFFSRAVDDLVLLVMERFDGPTVLDQQRRRGLDVREVYGVVVAAARALQCVHEFGFVHGDVKPQNVLYDERGEHRLIDFGVAQRWPLARDRYFAGTPEYMAPEAIRPGGTVRPATDVFALGIMTYELLSGVLPYLTADSPEDVLRMHLDATPLPLRAVAPTLPPALCEIVMAAIAPRVEARIATAVELADRLDEVAQAHASGSSTTAGPQLTNAVDGHRGRRR